MHDAARERPQRGEALGLDAAVALALALGDVEHDAHDAAWARREADVEGVPLHGHERLGGCSLSRSRERLEQRRRSVAEEAPLGGLAEGPRARADDPEDAAVSVEREERQRRGARRERDGPIRLATSWSRHDSQGLGGSNVTPTFSIADPEAARHPPVALPSQPAPGGRSARRLDLHRPPRQNLAHVRGAGYPRRMEPDPRHPESPSHEPPLPRVFGRYVLLRLLARGGMGEVYLAASGDIEGAERPVVIKVIRREHAKDPSFLARFLDEARVQSRLGYPGVAQVVEASMEGDEPFVAVEYVEGRSLAEIRARAVQQGIRVGWADASALAAQIAESLAVVHEHKDEKGTPLTIAHRDLSPQNVMVSFDGETKLIDFGTARGANRKSRTVAGVVYAKPGYVAPEVANGIPGGAAVDVYALGVMLWELVSGRRFLQGDAQEHMIAVGQDKRPLPPVAASAEAPAALDAILAGMTAHDREARVSAREACASLIKLLAAAPALASGERSVRSRVAALATSLWRDEPVRSRTEFQRLLVSGRAVRKETRERATRDAEVSAAEPAHQRAPAEPAADPSLLPGTRYRIVRTVGEGASGVVYEARHADLDRKVAVKVLSPSRTARPDDVARLRREAQTLGDISHPGLVHVHDFGMTSDGRAFLAMDFLEGESLDQRLGRDPELTWREAAELAVEALSALSAAHGAGIVHRDVTPANLMLLLDGGVGVLDFGVACDPMNGGEEALLDEDMTLFGTPEYMAPEQADGVVDPRCDLYAMGAVLYEAMTGRRPFADKDGLSVLSAKRKETPEAPSHRAPTRGIPAAMDRIVLKALAISPTERFQTAEEMREALFAALAEGEKARGVRRVVGKVAVGLAMTLALGIVGLGVAQRNPAVRERVDAAFAKIGLVKPKAPPVVVADVTPPADAEAPAAPAAASADAAPVEVVAVAAPPDGAAEGPSAGDAAPAPAAKPSDDPASPRMQAKAAMEKRRWRKAKRLIEAWMKDDPSDEAKLALATTLPHVGRSKEAIATLKELVESTPTNDAARELLHDLESKRAYRTAQHKPEAKGDKAQKGAKRSKGAKKPKKKP